MDGAELIGVFIQSSFAFNFHTYTHIMVYRGHLVRASFEAVFKTILCEKNLRAIQIQFDNCRDPFEP